MVIACHKFKTVPNISQAAYLRVFNSLTLSPGLNNSLIPTPYLVFLFDPVQDAQGNFTNKAGFIGDFLAQRLSYSNSYPTQAGGTGILTNYEWPGKNTILTAPSINGLNLSNWAQIPSGKHRMVFLSRPLNDTSFFNLPLSTRNSILGDTTFDFNPGEVYTAESVLLDGRKNKTGVYIRKENFTKTTFSSNYNYISFYNLSSLNNFANQGLIIDTLNIYLTAITSFCSQTSTSGVSKFVCYPQIQDNIQNQFLQTVQGTFQANQPYDSLPNAPQADFFYPDGTFRKAPDLPKDSLLFYYPNGVGSISGHSFSLSATSFNSNEYLIQSTVNNLEIINGKVYLMQITPLVNAPLLP